MNSAESSQQLLYIAVSCVGGGLDYVMFHAAYFVLLCNALFFMILTLNTLPVTLSVELAKLVLKLQMLIFCAL
jgi:hypothetical protein